MTAVTAPLAGARVVSLAINLPGPLAARRLADLGARVTKVEPPSGDPLAEVAPDWYRELVEGQAVRTLDLKDPVARRELDGLLGDAEVLLTASRPSALARLGLSWKRLHRDFPRLAQVAITGGSGPDAEQAGHDLTYQAAAGLLADDAMPRSLFVDLLGAEQAATMGIVAVVEARAGHGTYREVSLADAAQSLASPLRYGLTAPGGPLSGALPHYRTYRTADGHVALAALEPQFYQRVVDRLGPPDGWDAAFAAHPTEHWTGWASSDDVPLVALR